MPTINIDELVKPIEITVGGKKYTVEDISQETADKMSKLAVDLVDAEGKPRLDEKGNPKREDPKLTLAILKEILGADINDLAKLGMRKRSMLVKSLMSTINEELEAKNVPEVAVQK